jgi:hypothetical protein
VYSSGSSESTDGVTLSSKHVLEDPGTKCWELFEGANKRAGEKEISETSLPGRSSPDMVNGRLKRPVERSGG